MDVEGKTTQPALIFDGAAFDAQLDSERLTGQLLAVRDYLSQIEGGRFATVDEIASALGFPECSVSAQVRNLRKPRYGGYKVESKRLTENGLFGYRFARFSSGGEPTTNARLAPNAATAAGMSDCWHCRGTRTCTCIVCLRGEGPNVRPGPCVICVVPRRATGL